MLTAEDRKQKLEHGCKYFTFESCIDLSEPIKVKAYGGGGPLARYSIAQYSADVAAFISWWTVMVWKDLNGFSGFSNVKFEPIGFTLKD